MEIDKANAQANPILLDMPAFLKVTPERTAKGDAALAREREGVTEWATPKWSPDKGDSMEKFDQKFEDIVTELGYNTNIARGPNSRERILEIADDVGASTEFLKRFLGVETVEGTEEQIKDKAHVLLREQMGLPEVKGDKDMAAAKKAIKKATKTKAPKAAKEPKVKKAKTEGGAVRGQGYKGHNPGSRKEQAHKLFDELGAEKARPKIEKLGIAASTISSWFGSWGGTGKRKKKAD